MNENMTNVVTENAEVVEDMMSTGTLGKVVGKVILGGVVVGGAVLIGKGIKKVVSKLKTKKAAKADAEEAIEVEVESAEA